MNLISTDGHRWPHASRFKAQSGERVEVVSNPTEFANGSGGTAHVREIEERSLNAWPALSRVFLDGWIVGLSEGYTRRANSVNPLYPGLLEPGRKVEQCEATYSERDLSTVFKITPLAEQDRLDGFLADRNYEKVATTRVQTLTLDGALNDSDGAEILDQRDDAWMADYGRIKRIGAGELRKTAAVLDRIGVKKRFVAVRVNTQRVAAGIAAVEGDHVGLFGIAVDPDYRRRGWGRQVTLALLRAGASCGASKAYLQVEADNAVALSLYESMGFSDLYRYWYRVKARSI